MKQQIICEGFDSMNNVATNSGFVRQILNTKLTGTSTRFTLGPT